MQKYHDFKNRNQRGRSVLKLIAIIAVFGVIAIGIYTMTSRILNDRSDAAVAAEVTHVADGAKTLLRWYGYATDAQGRNLSWQIKSNAINEYMVCQGYFDSDNGKTKNCTSDITGANDQIRGVLSNGSTVNVVIRNRTMTGVPRDTGAYQTVSVTINQLNKSECVALATADWGKDLICMGTTISAGTIANLSCIAGGTSFPLTINDVTAEDSHFCTTDNNALTLLFF